MAWCHGDLFLDPCIVWIVGIHGANIITSFLTPIVLANMAANAQGANYPLAGEFNNSYVTVGGSGATFRIDHLYCIPREIWIS